LEKVKEQISLLTETKLKETSLLTIDTDVPRTFAHLEHSLSS